MLLPRVLPLTLVALLMVLPLKFGTLVEGLPAVAQQFDREFGQHERPWAEDLKAAAPEEAASEEAAPEVAAAPGPAPAGDPTPPSGTPGLAALPPPARCEDPALLRSVAEQKDELAARSDRLTDAEAVLAATEVRIGTQVERLSALKREIESLMEQRSALHQEDLKRMVGIYEAMKPKDAARIFSDLDTAIVIDVLDRMPERRSAPIIAELADAKAREVTRLILQRRALPGDRRIAEGRVATQ
jgi:flagellar motility protein MotE (MotC chaperone)